MDAAIVLFGARTKELEIAFRPLGDPPVPRLGILKELFQLLLGVSRSLAQGAEA
jgi:hypothetical protein